MQKETFDGKVTWDSNGKSATLTGLSREQVEQVLAAIQASGASVNWDLLAHHYTPPLTLGDLWRRVWGWLMPLLIICALSAPVVGQDRQARAVEPVRVLVSAPQDEANAELAGDVGDELLKLRDVVITGRNADYEVQLNAHVIAADKCKGVAVAVLVVRRSDNLHGLSVYVGGTSREVAAFIVASVDKEHFAPRRASALNRGK